MPWTKELEALGDVGLAALPLRERADAGRVVGDEDRADEGVFDLGFENFVLDHVGMFAGGLEAD